MALESRTAPPNCLRSNTEFYGIVELWTKNLGQYTRCRRCEWSSWLYIAENAQIGMPLCNFQGRIAREGPPISRRRAGFSSRRSTRCAADNRSYGKESVAFGRSRLDKRPFCGTLSGSKLIFAETKHRYATRPTAPAV